MIISPPPPAADFLPGINGSTHRTGFSVGFTISVDFLGNHHNQNVLGFLTDDNGLDDK